jgi:hypothetical protein
VVAVTGVLGRVGEGRPDHTTSQELAPLAFASSRDARPYWHTAVFLGVLLLFALLKLGLVKDHEIVASARAHDDLWQILSAARWYWGRQYDEWTLMHLPVYPLFVAAAGTTGLPLRISIELTYLAGAATLSIALGRLGVPRVLQVAAFALIVFHPDSFNGFDFALAETLYACLMLFFVAFFIRVLTARNPGDFYTSVILFAGVTALLWHSRKESILIGGLLGFAAILVVAALLFKTVTKTEAVRLAVGVVAAPLVAVVGLGAVFSAANGRIYGLWHTNELAAPNYVRAYASLQSIRPDRPLRFVPVTRETRERVYAVSPSFRELQPILDGEQENWGAYWTRYYLDMKGEIAAGWFYWALIDAAARAGHFTNARDAEAFFGRIADEVTTAIRDGRLRSRPVILPYVDPDIALWLPYVPHSFALLARRLLPSTLDDFAERPNEVTAKDAAAFDAVANRRVRAREPPGYVADGWALSSGPQPAAIEIVDQDGRPVNAKFESRPRPDVPRVADASGHPGPPALGFTMAWPPRPLGPDTLKFKVLLDGNRTALSEPIARIPTASVVNLSSSEPDFSVQLALDRMEPSVRDLRLVISKAIANWHPIALRVVALACALFLVSAWLTRRATPAWQSVATLVFVVAIVVERLTFFAVLDASAWNGDQARYIFPVSTLAAIVPIIVYGLVGTRSALGRLSEA